MRFPFPVTAQARPVQASVVAALALGLSGCISPSPSRPPTPVASLQPSAPGDDILWARKDGRRMSGDPVLYQQGLDDKQRCALEASPSGALDFPVFASCMNVAGYVQMKRRG